jgi:hypothetical protein
MKPHAEPEALLVLQVWQHLLVAVPKTGGLIP